MRDGTVGGACYTGAVSQRVRVFIASSLDGFIAGPGDDLSWLPQGAAQDEQGVTALGYEGFMADIGAILMGRRTFDAVRGLDIPWPYAHVPVLVATSRELPQAPSTVRVARGGSIQELVADAKLTAGGRDVYIDGGMLIRSALNAGLIDEIIVTVVPYILARGVPLFAGCDQPHPLHLVSSSYAGQGMVELTYRPKPDPRQSA